MSSLHFYGLTSRTLTSHFSSVEPRKRSTGSHSSSRALRNAGRRSVSSSHGNAGTIYRPVVVVGVCKPRQPQVAAVLQARTTVHTWHFCRHSSTMKNRIYRVTAKRRRQNALITHFIFRWSSEYAAFPAAGIKCGGLSCCFRRGMCLMCLTLRSGSDYYREKPVIM